MKPQMTTDERRLSSDIGVDRRVSAVAPEDDRFRSCFLISVPRLDNLPVVRYCQSSMIERIRQLVQDALRGENYERIILFGSRARGDFGPDSDYDILITKRDALSLEDKIRIFGLVRRHLAQYDIDADVIVKSESEVEYLRHKIGSVVESAIEEGVLL